MPRLPEYNEAQVQPRGLPDAAASSPASAAFFDGNARTSKLAGEALNSVGNALYGMAQREDADKVFRAEAQAKDDYIKTEQDWRQNRQGRGAKDLTRDAGQWWDEYIKKSSEGLGNDNQRRIFQRRLTTLREQSVSSVSNFESQQLEKSHDEAWSADKVLTVSAAAANANRVGLQNGPDVADLRAASRDYDASKFGQRSDGTPKGRGFLGVLRNSGSPGDVSTELTVGVSIGGKQMDVPTLVPTLTRDEVKQVLALKPGEMPPDAIVQKAAEFAQGRIKQGRSVFADDHEAPTMLDPVDSARLEIQRLNRYQAARKGWQPQTLAAENLKDTTELHKQVLQSLARDNPQATQRYFEKYKDEIAGQQQAEIGTFAKTATANAIGDSAADEVWMKHGPANDTAPTNLDVMEKVIREKLKDNEFAKKSALAQLKERSQAHEFAARERGAASAAAVSQAFLGGKSVTAIKAMPEFLALDGTKQREMIEHFESANEVRDTRAQNALTRKYYEAYERYADPEVLRNMSRNQVLALLPTLGNTLAGRLVEKYDAISKSDAHLSEARIDKDAFNAIAQEYKLDPFMKPSSGNYRDEQAKLGQLRDAVEREIGLAQQQAKRPLTREEKDTVARRTFSTTVLRSSWFGFSTTEVPAAGVLPKDLKSIVVPPADKENITKALQQRGKSATDEEVARWYLMGQQRGKRQ